MAFELRDYQIECMDTVLKKFKDVQSQLVQLPTGSGKTVILWHILKKLNQKALILAPTRELTEQLLETGEQIVDPYSIFRKTKSYFPKKDLQYLIMTNQGATWQNKLETELFTPDILVVDEAHRSRSRNLEDIITKHKDKGGKVLGLTATPERLDGKSLIGLYDELTYEKNLLEMIDRDYLVDLECYRIKTKHKIQEIKYRAGDIASSALKELDVESRNDIIMDIYKTRCPGKKTLIFCLSVEHAEKMAIRFQESGIRSMAVYGAMPKLMRKTILDMFKKGKIDVLTNCQLLTEGFDMPSIEALILARPTKSKALFSQMIGRGVRPYPGKDRCLVYDMSDEIHNITSFNIFGNFECEERDWEKGISLRKQPRVKETVKNSEYDIDPYELIQHSIDTIKANKLQKEIMQIYGIPFMPDISIKQAAYLIFKTAFMRKHGINSREYWERWRKDIPSYGQTQGEEAFI